MSPSPTVLAHAEARDERLSGLESAVRFSKANNLLGVIVEGGILVGTHLTTSHLLIPRCSFLVFLISLFSCSRRWKTKPYIDKKTNDVRDGKFGPDFRFG